MAAATPDIELWAPDLVYPESVSALRKLVARGALEPDDAQLGIERVIQFPLIVSSTAPLVKDAWQLRERMTVYDACYVVLARRLDARLITADASLVRTLTGQHVVHLGDLRSQ
jgi:predicted nucleic acid-binding protein